MSNSTVDRNKQIDRCHRNLYSFWKSMAQGSSKILVDNDQCLFTPLNMRWPSCNPLFRFSLLNTTPQALTQALLKTSKIDINISWWHDSSIHDTQTLEILKKLHKTHFGPAPILEFDLTQTLPAQDKYAVEVWSDPQNLNDYMAPIAICFDLDNNDRKIWQLALEASHQKFKHFYVRMDDKIVGVGSLYFDGETAGCYNLSVFPDYRKQGIATAIHIARLHAVKAMNYSSVTLQATPMVKNLDLSIGYQPVSELNIFW